MNGQIITSTKQQGFGSMRRLRFPVILLAIALSISFATPRTVAAATTADPCSMIATYIGRPLTAQERYLCWLYPTQGVAAGIAAYRAEQTMKSMFGDVRDGTKANAFKHCYWNVLMVESIGKSLASLFATAHESEQSASANKTMDLFNNARGRSFTTNGLSSCYRGAVNAVYNSTPASNWQLIYVFRP